MKQAPVWTLEEFKTLVDNPTLSDVELASKLPRRTVGAVGVVRAGLHSYHKGRNISMLSRMMQAY